MSVLTFENVTINGFRGLRNLRLDRLGRMNVVVGKAHSGKTSLLEALSILCRPLDPLEWLAVVRRRDFSGLDETCLQSLRWCFRQPGALAGPNALFSARCDMTSDGAFPLRELTASYEDIIGEPAPEPTPRSACPPLASGSHEGLKSSEQRGAILTHQVKAKLTGQASRAGDPLATSSESTKIYIREHAGIYPPSRSLAQGPEALRVESATLSPYACQGAQLPLHMHAFQGQDQEDDARKELVLEIARTFDPEIEAVEHASLFGGLPAFYLKHKRLGLAPLSTFGDGLRRAVLLAIKLPTLENRGLLLIDEIEVGIPRDILERMIEWLGRWALALQVQVVATTHSQATLDAIALSAIENPDDLVTYHLKQTGQETSVSRIDRERLLRLRGERGLDVS